MLSKLQNGDGTFVFVDLVETETGEKTSFGMWISNPKPKITHASLAQQLSIRLHSDRPCSKHSGSAVPPLKDLIVIVMSDSPTYTKENVITLHPDSHITVHYVKPSDCEHRAGTGCEALRL